MAKNEKVESIIELDLEDFLVPISIFLGALMISFSILYSAGKLNTKESADTTDSTNTEVLGEADTGNSGDTAGSTVKTSIENDAIKGDKSKAKVAIVEFSDYECPYCKRHYSETDQKIVEAFVNTGKAILVFRDLPLSFHGDIAQQEAMSTECAKEIGGTSKFWEMHDAIFNATNSNASNMTKDKLYELASKVGLNSSKFKTCLDSEKYNDEITKDSEAAAAVGIDGTPGFVIGKLKSDGTVEGEIISGAQPYEVFKAAIESYLD